MLADRYCASESADQGRVANGVEQSGALACENKIACLTQTETEIVVDVIDEEFRIVAANGLPRRTLDEVARRDRCGRFPIGEDGGVGSRGVWAAFRGFLNQGGRQRGHARAGFLGQRIVSCQQAGYHAIGDPTVLVHGEHPLGGLGFRTLHSLIERFCNAEVLGVEKQRERVGLAGECLG